VAPQEYQHRVEVVMQSLAAAVAGAQNLLLFLTEQQGEEWRRLNHLLRAADQDFNRAKRWLRRANHIR
jgi:predicted patatin/cPLA2 family phospholipase